MEEGAEKKKNIKKIEKFLKSYATYKVGIITLQKQLDYIMPDLKVHYTTDQDSVGRFNIKSESKSYTIDRIDSIRVIVLHENLKRYQLIVDSIDEALNKLTELEREFVELRYIEGKTIIHTSMKLGYSEKHLFNIRNVILQKLIISLSGLIQF